MIGLSVVLIGNHWSRFGRAWCIYFTEYVCYCSLIKQEDEDDDQALQGEVMQMMIMKAVLVVLDIASF